MWHCSINSRRLRLIPRMRLLPWQLCAGTGKTLEQALFAAEEHLPQRPSYRLCEYLFFEYRQPAGELSAW